MDQTSQLSLFDTRSEIVLHVRDTHGNYVPASDDSIISAARVVVEKKMLRGKTFNHPNLVKDFLKDKLGALDHEVFAVIYTDSQHRLIDYQELFRGTISQAAVYPRELVKEALKRNASAVIIAHNHPSGSCEPSRQDLELTKILKEALNLIDVRMLDHVIVGGNRTLSLAETGQL